MIITNHQIEFFKLQAGDTIIAFNPISKDSKVKGSRFGADVTLITTNHKDLNGAEITSSKTKDNFIIKGPGEYEVKGIFIKGALSKSNYDGAERINTIYSLSFDGIKVGFLGALSETELSDNAKSIISDSDILFVPIGGEGVLNSSEAHKLATKLGARIIIPMHYGEVGEKEALKKFLKESGDESIKPVDKLTVKKKDIEEKTGQVIVLSNS